MLDERLSLAASLFDPCEVGADIGTDHGLLPCHLLQSNVCQRMLLCDVSPKALRHAEENVRRQHLEARARLICADGLDALDEPCGCISITGMGGRTIERILTEGQSHLHGATLVLSAHTEYARVRQAVAHIGYHLTKETVCEASSRFYLFWRAEPGKAMMSPDEIARGRLLYETPAPCLTAYLDHRIALYEDLVDRLSAFPDRQAACMEELTFYRRKREEQA